MPSSNIEYKLGELGIVGFDREKDALRDTENGRVYYVKDDGIYWVSNSGYNNGWNAPGTMTLGSFVSMFSDKPERLELIDKTVFNRLSSGPLKDVKYAHDGICWGIAIMCKHKLKRGEKPHQRTVEAVLGVGKHITNELFENFDRF